MAIAHRQNRLLPISDKECFRLWKELGTLEKATNHLALQGQINPKYKQKFSPYTIRTAALRYVIEFPEEVKQSFDDEYGRTLPQEEWEELLVRFAMSIYNTSQDRLRSWIKRKGMQKYDYLWGKYFPNGKLDG